MLIKNCQVSVNQLQSRLTIELSQRDLQKKKTKFIFSFPLQRFAIWLILQQVIRKYGVPVRSAVIRSYQHLYILVNLLS